MTILGFDKPLYILPFEHRGSFQKKMFRWDGALSAQQTAKIAAAKRVIYDAFITATDARGEITRYAAVAEIARRYQEFVKIFRKAARKLFLRNNRSRNGNKHSETSLRR